MPTPNRFFACIMAGGSGERFWPMSRAQTPKHLLKLLSDRTLVEETVRRVSAVVPPQNLFVLTNEVQLPGDAGGARRADAGGADRRRTGEARHRARRRRWPRRWCEHGAARRPRSRCCRRTPSSPIGGVRPAIGAGPAARRGDGDAILTIAIKPDHAATGFGYLEMGAELARVRWRGGAGSETFRGEARRRDGARLPRERRLRVERRHVLLERAHLPAPRRTPRRPSSRRSCARFPPMTAARISRRVSRP
jgi:hypothetical protein